MLFRSISSALVEACGDRAVIILDGRYTKRDNMDIANREAVKRGYLAYQLWQGETFARATPVSQVWPVEP